MENTEDKKAEASKPKRTFKDWYSANKEQLLAKRRARYSSNPEARALAQQAAKEQRGNNPRTSTAGQPLHKLINGEQVEVYRIGKVAEMVGRTEQVIRNWEKKKWIPEPRVDATHRYYTKNQVKILREFALLIDQVRYQPAIRTMTINNKSIEVWSSWLI